MADTTWLQDMALRVRAVERDADKQILIESFLNVMQGNLAVFDILCERAP